MTKKLGTKERQRRISEGMRLAWKRRKAKDGPTARQRMRAEWYDVPDVWEAPPLGHRLMFMAVLTFGVMFWLGVIVGVTWLVEGRRWS